MTITTYTDKEIALKAQLAAMTAERDEYQHAADKMAWDHKEVRDRWIPMFDALQAESNTLRQQLAEANSEVEMWKATANASVDFENSRLHQQLAEAQALIEASRNEALELAATVCDKANGPEYPADLAIKIRALK